MKAFYTWNGRNAAAYPDPMIPCDASQYEEDHYQPLQQYQSMSSTQQTDIFSNVATEQVDPPSTVMREDDNTLKDDDALGCGEMFSEKLLSDDAATTFDRTGWTQPTEIKCPVPKLPLMVPPRQVSSGGLLSPEDANTLMPRPWGQTKPAMQVVQTVHQAMPIDGGHGGENTSSNSDSTPPSSPISPADVARIMSPCQRSQLRRYDRHTRLGTWKRLQPPYEAMNADELYAELCAEVRESHRHQRERDAWLAKYLRGTNTHTGTNASMGAGMNTGGGDMIMQDAVHPFGMLSGPPAPIWFPGLAGPVATTYHGYLSMAGEGGWQQPQAAAFIPNGQAIWGGQMSQEMYWHHMNGEQPILYDFGTTSEVMWTADTTSENGRFYGTQGWA